MPVAVGRGGTIPSWENMRGRPGTLRTSQRSLVFGSINFQERWSVGGQCPVRRRV